MRAWLSESGVKSARHKRQAVAADLSPTAERRDRNSLRAIRRTHDD